VVYTYPRSIKQWCIPTRVARESGIYHPGSTGEWHIPPGYLRVLYTHPGTWECCIPTRASMRVLYPPGLAWGYCTHPGMSERCIYPPGHVWEVYIPPGYIGRGIPPGYIGRGIPPGYIPGYTTLGIPPAIHQSCISACTYSGCSGVSAQSAWAQSGRLAWVWGAGRASSPKGVRGERAKIAQSAPSLLHKTDERLDSFRVTLLYSPLIRDLCAEWSTPLPAIKPGIMRRRVFHTPVPCRLNPIFLIKVLKAGYVQERWSDGYQTPERVRSLQPRLIPLWNPTILTSFTPFYTILTVIHPVSHRPVPLSPAA